MRQKRDWQVHAYCLLANHYHVVVETPEANLLQPEERLLAYPWSSFGAYVAAPEHRPGWGGVGEHHSGELHRASAEAKGERIVAEEFQRHGWQEAELERRYKNDPVKPDIAARLRLETTMTIKAIAARLHLGTSKAANSKLDSHMRRDLATDVTQTQSGS